MPAEPHSTVQSPAVAFSLLANPFARLGATARNKPAELAVLAGRIGSPEAAAALRTLSVPRTRLGAEVAFLPGAADASAAVLAALRSAEPPGQELPPGARVNLLAHVCAAGLASQADQAALVAAQLEPGDPALAAAIDADRAMAGMPALQVAVLPLEQDQLAEQHAAALVASCRLGPDPAGRLAALMHGATAGPSVGFMRRVAAAWARQSAADLARLEEEAGAASRTVLRHQSPNTAATARLVAAIDAWAALSLPQRLSDARAGLDHAPTLHAMRPWRETAASLTDSGRADLATLLAQALAERFADLPGEALRLQQEERFCSGLLEEQTLAPLLEPLRALATELADAPAPLEAALDKTPFGPRAPEPAARLWHSFDAAAAACVTSEAPWSVMRDLTAKIGGKRKLAGAGCALAIHRGLIGRAEAAGFDDLAARLRAQERSLERAVALWRYIGLADGAKQRWGGLFHRRSTLAALRAALLLSDDPAERATLLAEERAMVRRISGGRLTFAFLAGVVGMGVVISRLDSSYSVNAPYRTATPRAIMAPAGSTPTLPLDRRMVRDAPAPAPMPPPIPMAEPEAPLSTPEVPASTAPATPVITFPAHTVLAEKQPHDDGNVLSLLEVRWCKFNEVRLTAAFQAAGPAQQAEIHALGQTWRSLCDTYDVRRADELRAGSELRETRARLEREGRAMLTGSPPR